MTLKTEDEIRRWCVTYVARVLNQAPERIAPDAAFDGFGLDSAASVEMIVALEGALGREISPTLLFEQTSIAKIASDLAREAKAR